MPLGNVVSLISHSREGQRGGGGVGWSKLNIMLKILHYNINVMKDLIYHSEGRKGREGTFHEKRAATHPENFALMN